MQELDGTCSHFPSWNLERSDPWNVVAGVAGVSEGGDGEICRYGFAEYLAEFNEAEGGRDALGDEGSDAVIEPGFELFAGYLVIDPDDRIVRIPASESLEPNAKSLFAIV